jgi:hypothetical protein
MVCAAGVVCRDIDRPVDFYVKQLGFTRRRRYVDRQRCELILSSQWELRLVSIA